MVVCWTVLPAGPASFHHADISPLWEMAGLHRGYSVWPLLAATQRFYAHSCRISAVSTWTESYGKMCGSKRLIVLTSVTSFAVRAVVFQMYEG